MAMKKRYVKRLVQRIIFFMLTIAFLSLVTTMIVEKRMGNQLTATTVDESSLDDNGDQITPQYSRLHDVVTPRRPRPPVQLRDIRPPLSRDYDLDWLALVSTKPESQFPLPMPLGEKKDWHDYETMEADKKRFGMGEHGAPAHVQEHEKELEEQMFKKNGFNALISDKISVNRSVPDVRKIECRSRQYLVKLPNVSIVIIFFNEHFSTLLRSVHSIVNRTPKELLHQIVLVDDGSDRESLKAQLDDYVAINWPHLVLIVRNPERKGLIGARLAGAKAATGDVMIFFDSHIEVNYNWLPPLVEPIAINRKISTCPIIDTIDHTNFAYNGGYQEGGRGGFDWRFYYKQLAVLPEDNIDKSMPYRSPVMMGGLFAIDRQFFWDLGGYDDQLDIWGGEQYELSFKIWMCGGMLLDVPCSRVAHIFRGPMERRPSPRDYNFVARNHKRVAEVWMDEYKQYIYDRDPETYNKIDAGDLTAQRAVRDRLQCKSFHWFMTVVAPDFLEKFPPIEPPDYANGALQNIAHPQYCLDTMNKGENKAVGLFYCAQNRTHPQNNQFWSLSFHRDIRMHNDHVCLDVQDSKPNSTVWMWPCHSNGGNQFWFYDREKNWVVHGEHGKQCMEAIVANGAKAVVTNTCDANNEAMRWKFGFVNETLLDMFYVSLKT